MSMVSTLGKIAVGIMVAKGVGGLMGKSSGGSSGAGGGLGDLIGGLMGGKSATNGTGNAQSGSITDMLGSLMSGGAATGGLGGLLNSLSGNSSQNAEKTTQANTANDPLANLLSKAFDADENAPEPSEEEKAKIILKAMISAAKADGKLDDHEREQITKFVGDVTQEELAFIKSELDAPMDIDGLIQSVPENMAQEVYMMSLLAIDLDHQTEAEYLDKLARGLSINPENANAIHEKLNAPKLYNS